MRVEDVGVVAVLAAGLLLAGCQTVPGKTVASPTLQRDVTQMIMVMDRASDAGCQQRQIVNTEVVSVNPGGTSGTERWTLNRCGTLVNYSVMYTASPRGGTDFGVQLEK